MHQRWAYAVLGLGFVIIATAYFTTEQAVVPAIDASPTHIVFGETAIEIEVVDTPAARQKGLSGRTSLEEGKGMLFVFEESDRYGFWMPDMHFAIDILWLDENMRVVYVQENATPESYPQSFTPSAPALYVLEVPAFYAAEQGIVVGSVGALR